MRPMSEEKKKKQGQLRADPLTACLIQKALASGAGDDPVLLQRKIGRLAAFSGLSVNLLLAAGKITGGLLMSSLSVVGDGINNLSDALSNLISLLGFHLASKPPDKEHPYGHARIEYVFSVFLAFIVFYAGMRIFFISAGKVIHPSEIPALSLPLILFLGLSILLKYWLYRHCRALCQVLPSEILKAMAADCLSDILATGAILLSIFLSASLKLNLDAYFGILVGLMIIRTAWGVLRSTVDKIIGGVPSPELLRDMAAFLREKEVVQGFHDLRIYDYGHGQSFASIDIEVDGTQDLIELHDALDAIEREAEERFGLQLTTHMDPIRKDNALRQQLVRVLEEILPEIAENLSYHDLMLLDASKRPNCYLDLLVPANEKQEDEELKEKLRLRLQQKLPNCYPLIRVDRNFLGLGDEEKNAPA